MNSFFENEAAIFIVVGFVFFSIFVLILFMTLRQRKKMREYFSVFADKLGCTVSIPEGFFGGFPSISGAYRNRSLHVYMFTRSSGSGKNQRSTTYTAFTLDVRNPEAFEFHIYEQGFFSTLLTKFGMQDIQIGDEAFDKEYIVKSNNESKVRNMLTPMLISKFMDFADRYTGFGIRLKGSQFYYERPVSITNEKTLLQFEEKINFICDIADQIEELNRQGRN